MLKYILKYSIKRVKIKSIYSLIRILSLTIGLICFMVFLSIFLNELSYDKFNAKRERIFRLIVNDKEQGLIESYLPGAAISLFNEKFPQIEAVVRVLIFDHTVKIENNDPFSSKVVIADPGLFNIFSFKMIEGNGDELLKSPDKILVSKKEAKRLFKNENPIGKVILLNSSKQYAIGGIFDDIPSNSHLEFDYLLSTEAKKTARYLTDFGYNATQFYILLKDKTYKVETENAITDAVIQAFKVDKDLIHLNLQNLNDIYLHSANIQQHPEIKSGNYQLILFLPWIALLILVVVVGNYMILDIGSNISSIFRIGMHKVYGESKKILFVKFYIENLIYILSASLLTLLVLYYFGNKLQGINFINLNINELFSLKSIFILSLITLTTPLIPSVYSSKLANSLSISDAMKYKKSKVVEYKVAGSNYSINMRRLMLGFQFFTAICLIVASLVAGKQAAFIYNLNLGFDRNNILVVENYLRGAKDPVQRRNQLQQLAQNCPYIEGFASSVNVPLESVSNITQVRWPSQNVESEIQTGYVGIDHNFIKTIGAKIIEGRNFDESFSTDVTSSVIINQELSKRLGGNVIGKKLVGFWEEKEKTVIGVVNDIYFGSTNKKPDPMAFVVNSMGYESFLYCKTSTSSSQKALTYIQESWKKIDPGAPFKYFFLDDYYNNSNKKETTIKTILIISTIISLFLSLVGIISVSYLVSTSKIKEMGIRRVLGASANDIFRIFLLEYTIPFIIASLLAIPLAYIALNDWLTKYVNRITIKLDSFVFALGIIALLFIIISIITTYKITHKNIVDKLRYE